MKLSLTETINASPEAVWTVITDLENAAERITGITKVEVLERPESGVIGLKWRETRVMLGKEATEEMTISAAKDGEWFETTAYNCGSEYRSRMTVTPRSTAGATAGAEGSELTFSFQGTCLTWWAHLLSFAMGWMMVGSLKQCMAADLADLKGAAEKL